MKYISGLFIIVLILMAQSTRGQDFKVTEKTSIPLGKKIQLHSLEEDYQPTLRHVAPLPGGRAARKKLATIKEKRGEKIRATFPNNKKSNITPPEVLRNFNGNITTGIPNDNDMAISNGGIIVSVTNSVMYIFDEDGTKLEQVSLKNFADTLGISGHKYDPKVLYDPLQDRFIVACLNGRTDTTSFIILGFSQTNDPREGWNMYYLPGDPLLDRSWSDFPMLALTKDEVFLTINLLYNDSSWQKGFRQTVIWQMDKITGYDGDSLGLRTWHGIQFEGRPVRNLNPVQGGTMPGGPDLYFLSNKNFANQSDTFFLVHITGSMDDPNATLDVELLRSDNNYGAPPSADQPGDQTLQTNDARILGSFLQDDVIHFTGNTVNFNNNLATIFHGRIDLTASTPGVNLKIIDHPYLEFGYPSVVHSGSTTNGDHALIMANHTADTVFAGYSVLLYQNGDYSDFIPVKRGETLVNMYSADDERWGDYTGFQRRYNEPGKVWAAGYYGRSKDWSINWPTKDASGTWISEITLPAVVGMKEVSGSTGAVTYPNPHTDYFITEFRSEQGSYMTFSLYDMNGQLVDVILHELVKPGLNRFSFSTGHMKQGTYLLRIMKGQEPVATRKVIKQ